jgi:VWFA-related protein
MKVTIAQIKLVFLLLIGFALSSSTFAQPTLKETNRIKDFGQSLKKYEKKDEKETKKNDSKDEDVIRVETNLVVSDVLVVNQKGNLIAGLNKEDFIVTENNEPQEIGLFSFGEDAKIPRSIVLILDYSTSLLPYIKNSIEAAKLLVDKLGANDRMAIVTDDVELLVDFTKDKDLLKQTLEILKKKCLSFKQGGKSRQFSALLAVLNEIINEEDIRPIIILQSDGDEFTFLKPIKYYSEEQKKKNPELCNRFPMFCERSFGFSDVTQTIEKSRATIYSIIPGYKLLGVSENKQMEIAEKEMLNMPSNKPLDEIKRNTIKKILPSFRAELLADQTAVFEVAKLSGGYTDYIENPEDATTVYNTIFQTIENRYVIGYYPKNEIKDGKRRYVKVEVKGHPEYTVTGRKYYIAPLEEK